MISAVCWVPKGSCKPVAVTAEPPSKQDLDELLNNNGEGDIEEEEYEEGEEGENEAMELDEAARALAAAESLNRTEGGENSVLQIADALHELNMERYDDEDEGIELFSKGKGDLYYSSNEMDPYLINKDEDDDEDEIEDSIIKPTDAVLLCAKNDEEVNTLEVLVFEESEDGDSNMFVHHEIILSDFPLCMAWLDCSLKNGDKGNFLAVGSMDPAIEIWDLDIVDEVKPFLVLGGKKKKKDKEAPVKYRKGSHKKSVLGLVWNKEVRNVLASASADKSVKVWDVVAGTCAVTMKHHKDKVQAVAWNHHSPELLLSGSFDRSVNLMDVRSSADIRSSWDVGAVVESLAWNPHNEHSFVVTLDNGIVQGFDTRTSSSSGSRPSFVLHAHDKEITSVSYSPAASNLLATGSVDKMVKLWDVSDNQPSCVTCRNPNAGAIFSVSFSEDSPFLLAVGGSKGTLEVWDTLTNPAVEHRFGKYRKNSAVAVT